MGEQWKELTDEGKEKYVALAKEDAERAKRERLELGIEPSPKKQRRTKKGDTDTGEEGAEEEEREEAEEPGIAFYVPDGYVIQEEKPTEAELEFGNEAGDALIERQLMFHWGEVGWCQGEIKKRNGNKRLTIAGDQVNFHVYYPLDDNLSRHVLEMHHYAWGEKAGVDSWVLLRPVPAEGGAKHADEE